MGKIKTKLHKSNQTATLIIFTMQAIDTSNQTTQIQQSSLMAEANSYRMVNKSYYCYGCNKKYKKMMQVHDFNENGIECDHCGSDFCEAISSDSGLDQFL